MLLFVLVAISAAQGDPISLYRPLRKYAELFDGLDSSDGLIFDESLNLVLGAVTSEGTDEERRERLLSALTVEVPGVYSFPVFTPQFCNRFLEELDSYRASGLPIRRPNSMNNYGIIVNEIGMKPMLDRFQAEILLPIASLLFPTEGAQFDSHHSFMVQYKPNEDLGLDMHTDDSDVTFVSTLFPAASFFAVLTVCVVCRTCAWGGMGFKEQVSRYVGRLVSRTIVSSTIPTGTKWGGL
jgi:hypothetical protein